MRGVIQTLSDYYASADTSWLSWSVNVFLKKPVQWSYNNLVKKSVSWAYGWVVGKTDNDAYRPKSRSELLHSLPNEQYVLLELAKVRIFDTSVWIRGHPFMTSTRRRGVTGSGGCMRIGPTKCPLSSTCLPLMQRSYRFLDQNFVFGWNKNWKFCVNIRDRPNFCFVFGAETADLPGSAQFCFRYFRFSKVSFSVHCCFRRSLKLKSFRLLQTVADLLSATIGRGVSLIG